MYLMVSLLYCEVSRCITELYSISSHVLAFSQCATFIARLLVQTAIASSIFRFAHKSMADKYIGFLVA